MDRFEKWEQQLHRDAVEKHLEDTLDEILLDKLDSKSIELEKDIWLK